MRAMSPALRRTLVLAPLAAGLLAAGGCAVAPATPSATYTPPADGATFVYRVTSTGSYGNGVTEIAMRLDRTTFEGRDAVRFTFPGGSTVNERATSAVIAIFDAQGRTTMRYDPPLGYPWPLASGKTATQEIRLAAGPSQTAMPMTANWKVEGAEDVTVPAGVFRAWRVTLVDSFGFRQTSWSVPDALGMFARRESVRAAGHPQGPGSQTMELVSGPRR
ncbi:MAG: hypothetical protein RJA99_4400 [Pseudomonadota bacterium]|jgi:hypothetical protein